MPKTVRCYTHGPIGVDPDAHVYWEDVWITFKAKPGRKVYKYGPTLISGADLEMNYNMHMDTANDETRLARIEGFKSSMLNGYEEAIEDCRKTFLEAAEWDKRILDILEKQQFYIEETNSPGCPNVFTAAGTINKKHAEQMLQFLMEHLGYGRCKFVWDKPNLFICPVSIGNPEPMEK